MFGKRMVGVVATGLLLLTACGGPSHAPAANGSSSASSSSGPSCGGGGLTACASSSLGGGKTAQPIPGVTGGFTEVGLSKYFNADAVVAAGSAPTVAAPSPPGTHKGAGLYGFAFAEASFPSTGNWTVTLDDPSHTHVTFLIPAVGSGVRSIDLLTTQQTIAVPSGQYKELWLLEAGMGGYVGFNLSLQYSQGSAQTVPVGASGWCRGVDNPPEYLAYLATSHLGGTGQTVNGTCGLYAEAVAVDSTRSLVSVTLPATAAEVQGNTSGLMGIMAMSLQG